MADEFKVALRSQAIEEYFMALDEFEERMRLAQQEAQSISREAKEHKMYRIDPEYESHLQVHVARKWAAQDRARRSHQRFMFVWTLFWLGLLIFCVVGIYFILTPLAEQCAANSPGYAQVAQCVIDGNRVLSFARDILSHLVNFVGGLI